MAGFYGSLLSWYGPCLLLYTTAIALDFTVILDILICIYYPKICRLILPTLYGMAGI
jgi:hypothetical protein